MSSASYIAMDSGPMLFLEENIWSSREQFRLEIFFLPSDNHINFTGKMTFILYIKPL